MSLLQRCRLIASVALLSLLPAVAQADSIPELLHYRFDTPAVGAETSVTNLASSPPTGTATATLVGSIAQNGADLNTGGGGFSLQGSGNSSTGNYLNTGWATSLSGTSWTISFASSNIPSTTLTYYIFGDFSAGELRCFTGGVAGAGNWILRGNGITDVTVSGAAAVAPRRTSFVYDAALNEIRAYVDGVLVNTVPQAGPLSFGSAGPFKVGGYANSSNLPGLLDDFRLYDRALTAAEVADIDVRPVLQVYGNGVPVVDGDNVPDAADDTDFGGAAIAGTVTRTFSIVNAGIQNLQIASISFSGIDPDDFSVTAAPTSLLTPGDGTNFEVTFTPSAAGLRTAVVDIDSSDERQNPYSFAIQGNGLAPEIAVSGNSVDIAAGDLSPQFADHTDFGSVGVNASSVEREFTIANPGGVELAIDSVSIAGANPGDFSISTMPVSPVTAGGSTALRIVFDPSLVGLRSATVEIASDDGDEDPFVFAVQGTGQGPEIAVSGSGIDIADGDATPALIDATDFGTALLGTTVVHNFTIENDGNVDMSVGQVSFVGAAAADFSVTFGPDASVAPGGATVLQVTFAPSTRGQRSATLSIASDDHDENPFEFAVQGNGAAPEIAVTGNGNAILDGDAAPSLDDGSDFGIVALAGDSLAHTFVIQNTGDADLSIAQVLLGGSEAQDFAISAMPSPTVEAGGSTSLQVVFDPSAVGLRRVVVTIDNADADENPFTFSLQGIGGVADVQVSKTNFEDGVYPGRDTVYTIQVLNAGPAEVSGVHVVDIVDVTDFADSQWTCTSTPAGLCPNASGGPDIDQTSGPLPAGALLEYTLVATPIAAFGSVSNGVFATNIDGDDPQPLNNGAIDEDPVLPDTIFVDGFEDGGNALLRAPIAR